LSDPVNCQHETSCLVLPDVDSQILSSFLAKACLGLKELAFTNSSLAYLELNHRPSVKVEALEPEEFEQEFSEEVPDCVL
jgi:hypothetical protein